MPNYDYICDTCGVEDEFIIALKDLDEVEIVCECGEVMRRAISPVATVGIVFSNAVELSSIGQRFETNAQYRNYLKENSDMVPEERGSSQWKRTNDKARDSAEALAKKMGYTDLDDHNKRKAVEKRRKRELAGGT